MRDAPLFTVMTPTYDRAHTLRRVHDSLARQTERDFEWVVVDDGSTDGTRALVEGWARTAPFSLRYFRQENAGKHVAFNRGVREAHGALFLEIDSDDACVPHALERFRWHWERIPPDQRERFTGVTALCADQHGNLRGTRFPYDVTDSDSNEIRYRYGVTGDKWGFHRTEILRRFPFPEVPGARFVPEAIAWSAIARSYRTRYVNEVLHTAWVTDAKAEPLRLTNTALSPATVLGLQLLHRSVLNHDLRWFRHAPVRLLRSGVNFSRFSFGAGIGIAEQRRQLAPVAQLVWIASLPAGALAAAWDRSRGRTGSRARTAGATELR